MNCCYYLQRVNTQASLRNCEGLSEHLLLEITSFGCALAQLDKTAWTFKGVSFCFGTYNVIEI